MLINNKEQAIKTMNRLGSEGIPFVFLIDFEMKKIVISTQPSNSNLKVEMNGIRNYYPPSMLKSASYFEYYPISKEKYTHQFNLVKSEIQRGNSFLLNLSSATKIVTDLSTIHCAFLYLSNLKQYLVIIIEVEMG